MEFSKKDRRNIEGWSDQHPVSRRDDPQLLQNRIRTLIDCWANGKTGGKDNVMKSWLVSWLVEYVNEKGKKLTKRFETEKEVDAFCKMLDEKVVNGTCGGYICTMQKEEE